MPAIQSASIAESLLAEFEDQAPITRRFLERLPEDKLDWRPHEKSLTAGQLAFHLATTQAGVLRLIENNPAQAPQIFFPQPENRDEVLNQFEATIQLIRKRLTNYDDAAMSESWRLIAGEMVICAQSRAEFLRDIMFSHWYQHRGQFSVYLRLLGVPVPASWGPSGDEPPLFMQTIHEV
jgi:uncharacterized damage-inducible protein DinB